MASSLLGLVESILPQAVGYGTGQAMGAALTPWVQPIANKSWRSNPVMPLPPEIAAAVALKHPALYNAMATEAENLGFDRAAFAHIVDATDEPPGISGLLDLWRRGVVERGDVIAGLRAAKTEERWIEPLLALKRQHLSPADLGQLRQQGFIDQAVQHERSAFFGVDAEDAEHIFEISGLPPGIELMISLWRRGFIDEARVQQAIREGNVKTKYIPDLMHLRYVPPSPAVAAEAVLKQQIPMARGVEIAAQSGVDPETFKLMAQVNGRPMGVDQALDLVRRGLRDKDFFKEVVARSDVRVEYADDLLARRERLLPLFQVLRLLRDGTLTDELATRQLSMQGYSPELVTAIVAGGHAAKTSATKDLGREQIVQLYEAGFETREWALTALQSFGYDPDEAELVLTITEARKLIGYLNAVIARVKSRYVNHSISLDDALALLDSVGIQPDERQRYTDLWESEREANVRRLTQAQVGKLLKLGLIPTQEAFDRFRQMGFPEQDAHELIELVGHPEATQPSPVS